MIGFIVRRLIWAFLLAAVITLFTFVIFFIIPTDTRSTLSGRGGTDPTLAGQFHLRDKPVTAQYVSFLGHLVQHGDLGRSIRSGVPVRDTIIRASMVEAMEADYVRTAKAKGAGTWQVVRHHVLRNAMLSVVSMVGMDLGLAFGGALFIEIVFGLPGMGKLLVGGLAGGDLPVIMGVVLVVSFAVAIANLIVDVVYTWIDPRVRAVGVDEGSGTVAAPRLRLPAQPQVKESTT